MTQVGLADPIQGLSALLDRLWTTAWGLRSLQPVAKLCTGRVGLSFNFINIENARMISLTHFWLPLGTLVLGARKEQEKKALK